MLLKKVEHATGIETPDLASKQDFIDLKTEVDKLDINKLTNVSTSLYNIKTKIDELNVGKLKSVPEDLKKLNDVVLNDLLKTRNKVTREKNRKKTREKSK